MSGGFTFGFSNDDTELSEPDVAMADSEALAHPTASTTMTTSLIPPQLHSFDEILASLPSSLSYAFTSAPLRLPRRELFDIRAQLMTEADPSSRAAAVVGLNAEDIEPGVYEGGFKTWECAVDLARFVLRTIHNGELDVEGRSVHIIELGAGTALPSAAILHHLLTRPLSTSQSHGHGSPPPNPAALITLTVADYNAAVLSLATGPNLFLSSLAALDLLLPEPDASAAAGAAHNGDDTHADLEPSASLLAALRAALRRRNVALAFLSGAWGAPFADCVATVHAPGPALDYADHDPDLDPEQQQRPLRKPPLTLVLASETIYQPATLPAFADTLLAILRTAQARKGEARAYVAAKRVYFGVGGGVPEFCAEMAVRGAAVRECWASESDDVDAGKGKGVGRCILEVQIGGQGEV